MSNAHLRASARATQRRRRTTALTAVVAVVVAIATLVVVKVTGSSSQAAAPAASAAPVAVVTALGGVPDSVIDSVGVGAAATAPQPSTGGLLTAGGKPRVVFVGDEWCPFCAAERWALAQALSRFGTFTGLGQTTSASDDSYPGTATLSFHGATYTSAYLSFSGYELEDRDRHALDALPADVAAFAGHTVPFVALGGTAVINGASYDPGVLEGKTQAQIAAALSDPSSPISRAVVGSATLITRHLCTLTGGQPADVCSAAGVSSS